MSWVFKKINKTILKSTKAKWLEILGDETEFNPSGYYQFLDSAEAKLEKRTVAPDSHCYALSKKGDKHASALFMITHALPKSPDSWVKVLDMRTSPAYDLRRPVSGKDTVFSRRETIGTIIPKGLINILALTYSAHKASKLKIWGNKQVDIDLFNIFKDLVEENKEYKNKDLGFSFNNYSQWLEISKQ